MRMLTKKNTRKAIQEEHIKRLKSLVAVDDIVRQVVEYLKNVGEWNHTYFFYTSDHGYNLGQFRVDSHKTMVYDHNLRVPLVRLSGTLMLSLSAPERLFLLNACAQRMATPVCSLGL